MSQQDYDNGLKVRTEVMGESFVKRAQDNTVPFTQPLQDWINEHAWGSTWQREGVLPRKYRSLITIAFLTALKSPTELKGHIRGALTKKFRKSCYTACPIVAHLQHRKLFAQRWKFWQNTLQILKQNPNKKYKPMTLH